MGRIDNPRTGMRKIMDLRILLALFCSLVVVALADDFAHAQQDVRTLTRYAVPLVTSSSNLSGESFVRIINRSKHSGPVEIDIFDDDGRRYGPLRFTIAAEATSGFTTSDLENGRVEEGIRGHIGPGRGDWRLVLTSDLEIDVLSYIRTADGFVAPIHDRVPRVNNHYHVPLFIRGSATNLESRLRISNVGNEATPISITFTDDLGNSSKSIDVGYLEPRASLTYSSADLASGIGSELDGGMDKGTGNWRVTVAAREELIVQNLLVSSAGYLTNLSTDVPQGTDSTYHIPLFPSASDASRWLGLVRIINRSTEHGSISINARDTTDRSFEPVTLSIGPHEAKQFNSDDLEQGNATIGLDGRTGAGVGAWQLELQTDLNIQVLAYVQAHDGLLTAIHDTVVGNGNRYRIPLFEPQQSSPYGSFLRVLNLGNETAHVQVKRTEGTGTRIGRLNHRSIQPGSVDEFRPNTFDAVRDDLGVQFGDHTEDWQLELESSRPIKVMNLRSNPTGHLTNLSTVPSRTIAPRGADDLLKRFSKGWILDGRLADHLYFFPDGRFQMTAFPETHEGFFSYERTGPEQALLKLTFDTGYKCAFNVTFSSKARATHTYGCDDGHAGHFSINGFIASSSLASNNSSAATMPEPFALATGNIEPVGIVHANGRFYIPDADGTVYVYSGEGEHLEDLVFNLEASNSSPTGIDVVDSLFYVVDEAENSVFVYDVQGVRVPESDFDLSENNDRPRGITHLNGRIYVTDYFGHVFAYLPNGELDNDSGFDLDSGNLFSSGITFANERFYVVDWLDRKVYAYSNVGERLESFDFDFYPEASFGTGITHDGQWFYVVDEIVDRVWVYSGESTASDGPDLTVSVTERSDTLNPGESFDVTATVRNEGNVNSPATTLRYVTSDISVITSFDSVVGSAEIPELEPAETSEHTITLTAPQDPGDYYYGACVESVEGETDEHNNCSGVFGITVPGEPADDGLTPSVRQIVLDSEDSRYSGIAYSEGTVYAAVGGFSTTVHAFSAAGDRIEDADFELDPDNRNAERIANAEGLLFVIDDVDNQIYAYGLSGRRLQNRDFALDESHIDHDGLTFADGTFYVVDELFSPDRVFAYSIDGTRIPEADFDLHEDNGGAVGIAHANGRLFVVDTFDQKVFAYTTAGERIPSLDFSLTADNESPRSLEYGGGSFFVADRGSIYIYSFEDGAGVSASDLSAIVATGDRRVGPDSSLTLDVTVRSQGDTASASTILRYFSSTDSTIDTGDTELGSVVVPELRVRATSSHEFTIDVPAVLGTYYYGACVDALPEEANTENNCSGSLLVEVVTDAGPDLDLTVTVEQRDVWTRESFKVDATVRNRGDLESGTIELGYYLSTDQVINSDDTLVREFTLENLDPGAAVNRSVTLFAPGDPGTYYYGVCVASNANEAIRENNCSAALTISTELEVCAFELDPDNRRPLGVAATNATLYVADDGFMRNLFAYSTSGEREPDSDIPLASSNRTPFRVVSANGKLYVMDRGADKVFVYTTSGVHETDLDFDLATEDNVGLASANGSFYVIDEDLAQVLAYDEAGDRSPGLDFALGPYNSSPFALAFADEHFLVADSIDRRVYAYTIDGERNPNRDIDLFWTNVQTNGIAFDGANLQVLDDSSTADVFDRSNGRIFAYPIGGDAIGGTSCFRDGAATTRLINENVPGGINVGEPVTATGGDSLRYVLTGVDADSFSVVPETGQIRTRTGVVYDYETKSKYSVDVEVFNEDETVDTIDVTINVVDLLPSCPFDDAFNIRTVIGNGQVSLLWDPLPNEEDYARILGYETEIRALGRSSWTDRRTFIGQNIGGTVYANLENDIEYQLRLRALNAEGECGWTWPVRISPTNDLAPKDAREHHDRFGPRQIGTPQHNYRLLTPGRCRHFANETSLDANCTFERTSSTTGTITLEFDDPSKGSCGINLSYSSLTAGSFVDECFDAGVNTEVEFDRSFRMPSDDSSQTPEPDVARAPRTPEEFDVYAWGREDLIPGLGFGCPPVFESCMFHPGSAYSIERNADTNLPHWTLGSYTYRNTGNATGTLSVTLDGGDRFEIMLQFEASGQIQATFEKIGGSGSSWPGMPHLDLTLDAPTVLLPIPPSWSTAIAVETLHANVNEADVRAKLINQFFPDFADLVSGHTGLNYRQTYKSIGRNRAMQIFEFPARELWVFNDLPESKRDRRLALNGTKWIVYLDYTSDGTAEWTLDITKKGFVSESMPGFVDFYGTDEFLDEIPPELQLPDEAPQASGEDHSGVETAVENTVDRIDEGDLQTIVVSASEVNFLPGDWLEPKDGGNQRMMIVGVEQHTGSAALPAFDVFRSPTQSRAKDRLGDTPYRPLKAEILNPHHVAASYATRANTTSGLLKLTTVCMQFDNDFPPRGARFFSKAKVAEGPVQLCQKECVLEGGDNIQGCVWDCE